jgi:hypothetical protein
MEEIADGEANRFPATFDTYSDHPVQSLEFVSSSIMP